MAQSFVGQAPSVHAGFHDLPAQLKTAQKQAFRCITNTVSVKYIALINTTSSWRKGNSDLRQLTTSVFSFKGTPEPRMILASFLKMKL